MTAGLNREHTLERTEWVQEQRKKIIDNITKDMPAFHLDGELTTTMLSALKDYEKQELHKDKMAQELEESDKDRAVAEKALAMVNEMRKQRRGMPSAPAIEMDETITIPEVDEALITVEADTLATEEKSFKETEWSEFRKEMINQGLDPNYTIDEEGNVVPIKRVEQPKED